MTPDLRHVILEAYFFEYIDRGIRAGETPLFTRMLDGRSLAIALTEVFQVSPAGAEDAINQARQEVAL